MLHLRLFADKEIDNCRALRTFFSVQPDGAAAHHGLLLAGIPGFPQVQPHIQRRFHLAAHAARVVQRSLLLGCSLCVYSSTCYFSDYMN